jgi:Lrp/AsnC family transcriptional regulator, leucine-responsive regulatory protein
MERLMPRKPTRRPRSSTATPAVDHAILAALEQDGRLSHADLAERIDRSKTATWNRVRDLEARSVIAGYRADIEPAAVGLAIHAFVQVTIRSMLHAQFEQSVLQHWAILECYTTAGQADYLLHVLVADVSTLDTLLRSEISRMPGVERITTTVGLKTIKRRGMIMPCVRS